MNINNLTPPGRQRPSAWRQGIIQIHLTRACDRACSNCTQGSQFKGKATFISTQNFEIAVKSLVDYFGVVGIFGGNPALHPEFFTICHILAEHIPWERRGIWCNHPFEHGKLMSRIFNPNVSNLNVHQNQEAYEKFRQDWPTSKPFGLDKDSRHAPVHVDASQLISREEQEKLIENCDINKYWSAMIGEFRGQPRAWFCEVAGGQAILNQEDPNYPDTGIYPSEGWWKLEMLSFADQVEYHCFRCGVPLRSSGHMANENITDTLGYNHKVKKGTITTYSIQPKIKRVVDYV